MKLNILHTTPSMENNTSGVTICVRRLAQELARCAVDVSVLSLGAECTVLKDGYSDIRFGQDGATVPLLSAMGLSHAMRDHLKKNLATANVIHNHGLWTMANVYGGWVAGQNHKTPLIISPHGMLNPGALQFSKDKKRLFWKLFQGKAAHGASCFHATSDEEAEDIRAYGLVAPIALVPNGVDLPKWQEKPSFSGRYQVISLGRIHPVKALDRLVAAWAQLEDDFPDWDLLLVGPDENNYARELKDQAKALGLKNFKITDPVFGAEKDALLRQSDLFALPTLSENFALTVAESLAVGTPVISSKGAPWQGLEKNGCGWWIDHGADSMAASLRHAMSLASEERAAMGERGRAWMKRDFGWESIAKQMIAVYSWLETGEDKPDYVRID